MKEPMGKTIGVVCLVVGVALLLRGHDVARSVDSQIQNIFTGSPAHKVIYYYLGGAVLCAVGLTQIFWKQK
jgi:uncharacterized membrane protein